MAGNSTRPATHAAAESRAGPQTANLLPVKRLKPLQQGSLDGLCGLYAGINGLRLLLHRSAPLKRADSEWLFRRGVRFLNAEDKLSSAVRWGMKRGLWRALVAELADAHGTRIGRTIAVSRPFKRRAGVGLTELLAAIEGAVHRRCAVLLLEQGGYDHFTVVAGYDSRRLLLFDSSGYAFLKKRTCGVDDDPAVRHRLVVTATLILEVVDD